MRWYIFRLALIGAASACGGVQTATAAPQNGSDLLRVCAHAAPDKDAGFCLGYIHAMVDTIADSPELGCLPSMGTIDPLKDVVVQYLTAYPEMRTYPAYLVVADALSRAYPCAQTPVKKGSMRGPGGQGPRFP